MLRNIQNMYCLLVNRSEHGYDTQDVSKGEISSGLACNVFLEMQGSSRSACLRLKARSLLQYKV